MPRVLTASDLREFRNRVCAVATELFAELGYDGFNMRELAGRLGVSAMTAYRYFNSKDDILVAVRARAFDRLAVRLEMAGAGSGSTSDRLVAVCRTYVDFAREEQPHYRLMFDLSLPGASRTAELVNAEHRAYDAVAVHARSFARAGLPGGDPERFARVLFASLHGIVALTLMETFPDSELDGLFADAIRRLANSCGRVVDHGFEPHALVKDRQARGAERSAVALSPIPLTAAE
jgi:AcrR family transcriptional regulator